MFKNLSIKARYIIFNIFMALGGIFAAIKILYGFFFSEQEVFLNCCLVLALAFFLIGFIFRLTVVKCPFCGDKLRDHQKTPLQCPTCGRYAFESPAHPIQNTETIEESDTKGIEAAEEETNEEPTEK